MPATAAGERAGERLATEAGRRLKVLAVAYAVHPDYGSELGLGWNWIRELSRWVDLHVICGSSRDNKQAIARELAKDPLLASRVAFTFLDPFWPTGSRIVELSHKITPFVYYRRYKGWMRQALDVARELIRHEQFDVAHQLNMVGFREPGFLWQLGLPFVWGPIGGTYNTPLGYINSLGALGFLTELLRSATNAFQLRFSSRVAAATRRANGLVAANRSVRDDIRRATGVAGLIIPEVGTDPGAVDRVAAPGRGQELSIVWSGLHIYRKALPLLLFALGGLKDHPWRLDILGEGRCTARWRSMAKELGIEDRCVWHGWVTRESALDVMRRADIFVSSSLRETTSTVIVEALSLGLPCITTDHCGMADAVTPDCGFKVPVRGEAEIIAGFRKTLREILTGDVDLAAYGAQALARAGELTWRRHAEKMVAVYEQAIASYRAGNRASTP